MLIAIFRKLIFWISGILLLCLLSFLLLQAVPGDPVLAKMHQQGFRYSDNELAWQSKEYAAWRKKMHLDLPIFYFSISPLTQPEGLLKINNPNHSKTLKKLCIKYGATAEVMKWHDTNLFLINFLTQNQSNSESVLAVNQIMSSDDFEMNNRLYTALIEINPANPVSDFIKTSWQQMLKIEQHSSPLLSFLPAVRYNGNLNRFHIWFFGNESTNAKGVIFGDFGNSYRTSKPVGELIKPAIQVTLKLAFVVILLLYFVSIPLGVKMATPGAKNLAPYFVNLIFALYAMPSFWIALLMITFLCNPAFLNWFPAAYSLIDIDPGKPLLIKLLLNAWYLLLPVTCWSLGGVAFISLQTFSKSRQIYLSQFIVTARAKGLNEDAIARNHILPNASIPAISLLGGIVPAAISGAIAIELIFSISGMGQLIFAAFQNRDYPVVMAVMLFAGTAALIGSVISDILLAAIDPRVQKISKNPNP